MDGLPAKLTLQGVNPAGMVLGGSCRPKGFFRLVGRVFLDGFAGILTLNLRAALRVALIIQVDILAKEEIEEPDGEVGLQDQIGLEVSGC